jgi:precorrin-6B methylase 2
VSLGEAFGDLFVDLNFSVFNSISMMKPVDPLIQRQAMMRKLERRMACEGKFVLPAVPALVDDYTARCEQLFLALGRKLNPTERDRLHEVLASQLEQAFSASQRSSITISYEAKVEGVLHYVVSPNHASIATTYDAWVSNRQPPFFGVAPDAKAMALAKEAAEGSTYRVLDIGAGTGRNALALARLGHPVDAVEVTPKFASILEEAAQSQSLPVRVVRQDVFQAQNDLRRDYQMMLVSEVVSDFRSANQLRALFELAVQSLACGGKLVMNAFIARTHYSEDDAVRQFAQQAYSAFFTESEWHAALKGLPLICISDECVHDYEQANLPSGAWPHTPWYPNWVNGLDVFSTTRDDVPLSLRWLVLERTSD